MILWTLLGLMIAVTVAGLALPLVRRADTRPGRGTTLGVLKEQLRDLDAQDGAESEGLRTEIKRRILAEGREEAPPSRLLADRTMRRLAVGLAAAVALVSAGLYATLGRPDLADGAPAVAGPEDVAGLIRQLEMRMAQAPDDPEGWRMLGWSYQQTGRFEEAATAYGRAAALEPGKASDLSAQGEALVQAADGAVTPAALDAFKAALAADPADPRARYFLALHKDQNGDHKGAMDDWIALLNDAPADAPWAAEVRTFVQRAAAERGVDIAGRLPAAPPDRQAMIRGMVEGLDARLRADPADAEGWVRLMRSRMVLGEGDKAAAAYRDARGAFAGDAERLATLQKAARELGVPGA